MNYYYIVEKNGKYQDFTGGFKNLDEVKSFDENYKFWQKRGVTLILAQKKDFRYLIINNQK